MLKFIKKKVDSLMGQTEVHYEEYSNEDVPFTIQASIAGVRLRGDSPWMHDREALDSFAKALSDAWIDHTKLKPNLMVSKTGH